nr:PREDICTED: ATP synthase subunit g, mitochondrial [Opisthocomus hoazin]
MTCRYSAQHLPRPDSAAGTLAGNAPLVPQEATDLLPRRPGAQELELEAFRRTSFAFPAPRLDKAALVLLRPCCQRSRGEEGRQAADLAQPPRTAVSSEALRNGLVATEVLMWFYIGEIIGKGGLIGYNV